MIKIFIVKGSFTGFAIGALLVIGVFLIFGSLEWIGNFYFKILGYSLGMTALAGAGYGGRAKALGLRPFGQSEWRSAKSTYKSRSERRIE